MTELAQHSAVAAADHQHPARIFVGEERQVGHHLVVGEFVEVGQLNDAVKQQQTAEFRRLTEFDLLKLRLTAAEFGFDLHGHAEPVHRFGHPEIRHG